MLELRDSGVSPQALKDKPVLHDWMREYLVAYQILNRTRQFGMGGPQPIQLTEIVSYLRMFGTYDVERFVEYILQMDATYLSVMASRAPKTTQESPSNGRKPSSS